MTRAHAWLAVLVLGCQGSVLPPGGERPFRPGEDGPGPAAGCDLPQVDLAPLEHLTRAEYDRATTHLLGFEARAARDFAADDDTSGYEVGARVSPLLAEQYVDAAESLAEQAVATRFDALLDCDVAAMGEDACARQLISRFGMRAFRRPLEADEAERLFALYQVGRAYDFRTGIQVVIQGVLSAPSFLYHVESAPDPAARPGDTVALDDFAVASRLSFFLWGSIPDDTLLEAAGAGELSDPAGLEAQARRMLEDERAIAGVRDFARQWLHLDVLEGARRDAERYPDFEADTGHRLRASVERYVEDAFLTEGGDVDTLLLGTHAYVDGPLARSYGIDGVEGDDLQRVELDPSQRAGLLTQPGLLTVLSKPNQSDPIHRGLFVRTRLLCQQLPPPPDDIAVVAPDPAPGLSTRERFAEHSQNERCRGCHQLMDPIGFGFEHYDAMGRWRELDEGATVDATGEVLATVDADGAFYGVPELAGLLAGSQQVRECVAMQLFRYAMGRTETEWDLCSVQRLQEDFHASGYDLRALMIAVVQSDAFRHQQVPSGVIRD
ncbi:MAG: DUF1592 domain-containing protein [Sandaracinaceae bacterium]